MRRTGGSTARSVSKAFRRGSTTACWCGTSCAVRCSRGSPNRHSTRCWARAWSCTPKRRQRQERPVLPRDTVLPPEALTATAGSILATQEASGAIPWFAGGHVDAWDHVECAMALSVAGQAAGELTVAAERAYDYLRRTQA